MNVTTGRDCLWEIVVMLLGVWVQQPQLRIYAVAGGNIASGLLSPLSSLPRNQTQVQGLRQDCFRFHVDITVAAAGNVLERLNAHCETAFNYIGTATSVPVMKRRERYRLSEQHKTLRIVKI